MAEDFVASPVKSSRFSNEVAETSVWLIAVNASRESVSYRREDNVGWRMGFWKYGGQMNLIVEEQSEEGPPPGPSHSVLHAKVVR